MAPTARAGTAWFGAFRWGLRGAEGESTPLLPCVQSRRISTAYVPVWYTERAPERPFAAVLVEGEKAQTWCPNPGRETVGERIQTRWV